MYTVTKLPAYDGIKERYYNSGSYVEYKKWRKSKGYLLWRRRQWARQSGQCYYCRISLRKVRVNVEHISPQRTKTRLVNDAKNLVLSCSDCNKAKGSKVLSKKLKKDLVDQNKKAQHEYMYQKYYDKQVYLYLTSIF